VSVPRRPFQIVKLISFHAFLAANIQKFFGSFFQKTAAFFLLVMDSLLTFSLLKYAMEGPSEKTQRLCDLAERLINTMSVARGLVRGGRTLDLAGIEDGVGLLCAQALDLPAEQGRNLAGLLRDVLAEVEGLTAAVREAGVDSARHGRCS
jgi:hypothetical protein